VQVGSKSSSLGSDIAARTGNPPLAPPGEQVRAEERLVMSGLSPLKLGEIDRGLDVKSGILDLTARGAWNLAH
jgi:hypothetical protein